MFSVKFRPPQQAPVQDTRDLLKAALCDVELATRAQKASCCRSLRAIAQSRENFVRREVGNTSQNGLIYVATSSINPV
jgi:hypothetical protein